MAHLLIIDDDPKIRHSLKDILEFEGYEITEASDGLDGLAKLKKLKKLDLILLDIKMPKMDGMEALERIQILRSDIPVIMISGHATIDTAVDAVKKGAFDFISKPPDLNRLLITIRNALDKSSLVTETKKLKRKVSQSKVQKMIGSSEALDQIRQTIDQVAPTDARVLVTGPNGTGKELVARSIHKKSSRSDQPIVEVNCAAIPSELIESELFGHEKGAFTSAHKQRKGKFEEAHGGTLFLDEIGDMSMSAQAKVLRALQENRIRRVGGEKEIQVDVRVVAATNKDLRAEIEAGRFREDLYHRLAVIIVQVPALNERRDDIPELVGHFIEQVSSEQGRSAKSIEPQALVLLQEQNWTGNIRELRNVVERLIILSGKEITREDVERYVVPVSADQSNPKLNELFSRCNDLDEVLAFVREAYTSRKS
jgi:two-component system, NtrC family, nitrogen regulation response regulator NtrX